VALSGGARRVALEIVAYLIKHPEAKDSLAGIRLWWLEEPDKWSDKDVRRATEALIKRGLLRVWEPSPGSVVFGPTGELLQAPDVFLREFDSEGVEEQH
jgi:hypothetical protein